MVIIMNKNIIIAILVVIIIAAGAAFMFGHSNGKMATQINFLNNDTLQNGETVIFDLKDASGNPIAGETVNITFNSNEKYSVVTDNNGKGYLLISGEDDGKYDVLADYGGNDKYDASNAKVTITITDDAPDNPVTQVSNGSIANTNDNNGGNDNGGNGNNTDPTGNRYFIPQYELWVEDGIVVDGPVGVGMTLDDWIATYTPENPHFDDPDDPYNPYYDPDHPYPGDNSTDSE